jgi:hypothetical protein
MKADPLLLLYVDGECSAAEAESAEAMLRASPSAQRAFALALRQRLMLAEVCGSSPAGGMVPVVLLPDRAVAPAGRTGRLLAAAAVAAAVLLGAILGWRRPEPSAGRMLNGAGSGGTESGRSLAYGEPLRPPATKPLRVELADGSRIEVSAGGLATLVARRQVRLDSGSLQVGCRPDPDRPFTVEAGGTSVRALGTEFVVEMRQAGAPDGAVGGAGMQERGRKMRSLVSVLVLSGAVMVTNPFGELRLAAGESGNSPEGGRPERGRSEVVDRNADPQGPHTGMTHESGTVDQGWHGERPSDSSDGASEDLGKGNGKGKGKGKGQGRGQGQAEGQDQGQGQGQGKGHGKGQGKGEEHGQGEKNQNQEQNREQNQEQNREQNAGEEQGNREHNREREGLGATDEDAEFGDDGAEGGRGRGRGREAGGGVRSGGGGGGGRR